MFIAKFIYESIVAHVDELIGESIDESIDGSIGVPIDTSFIKFMDESFDALLMLVLAHQLMD